MISVIVPVYNVEKYLECCINSILNQTYKDFELILVDDGSNDNSSHICDEYKVDKRVKVFHKENGGAVSACNFALKCAQGEYICFIDGDDFVAPDYIQCLYEELIKDNVDMVCMNCIRHYNDNKQFCYTINHWSIGIHSLDDDFYSEFLCWDKKLIANSRWGKLINAEIVKKYAIYCSEEVTCGEDQQLIIGVLLGCKKVKLVDEYKYYYRCNPNSIMNTYKKNLWNKYKILVNTVSSIPEIIDVKDFKEQVNGKLLLSICACIKNEEYCGRGLSKNYFITLFNDSINLGLFSKYKVSNVGKLHFKMLKALKTKSFFKIKLLLFLNRIYNKLK